MHNGSSYLSSRLDTTQVSLRLSSLLRLHVKHREWSLLRYLLMGSPWLLKSSAVISAFLSLLVHPRSQNSVLFINFCRFIIPQKMVKLSLKIAWTTYSMRTFLRFLSVVQLNLISKYSHLSIYSKTHKNSPLLISDFILIRQRK